MQRLLYFSVMAVLCRFALGQPVANFQAASVAGCAPLVVTFEDLSSQAVAWEWNTGAGQSQLQTPTVLYSAPGTYSVSLIVTDAAGRRDTLVRPGYIQVYPSPDASLSASATQVCAHALVAFTSNTAPGAGSIVSYRWDFGDGVISTEANPLHAYAEPGVYPVSLEVRNSFGCTDLELRQAYMNVSAPDPGFTADTLTACGPPLQVRFTSYTASGIHRWEFGDGSTSTLPNPLHTYTGTGAFSVTHTVTGAQGCRDTLVRSSYINIGVNTLSAFALDSSTCAHDTIFFRTNAAPNSTITWDFGDGTQGSGPNPFHIYHQSGSLTATVTIQNPSGCNGVRTVPVTIYALPDVDFRAADTTLGCETPFPVSFINETTGAFTYRWDFGDGSPVSTLQHPSHPYTQSGSFNVRLTAFGPGGCVASKTSQAFVTVSRLKANLRADIRGGCVPLEVAFQDSTESPYPLASWRWDFGDGHSSTAAQPVHTYTDTGRYTVRLIVTNSGGCTDTIVRQHYISVGRPPVTQFAADTNRACALLPVQFTNLTTGAQRYIWFFGDGDTSMATHPVHGFAALGMLDVALIASDRGCTDTMVQSSMIEVLAPLPLIGVSERKICELPRTVTFQNLSIGADTWNWTLDSSPVPGQPSTLSQTYTAEGWHDVALTAVNHTTGCIVTARDSIIAETVRADMLPSVTAACSPVQVRFTDQSYRAVKWSWDFGTAALNDTSALPSPLWTYADTGHFTVRLIVENRIRCRDTLMYRYIRSLGTNAEFTTLTPAAGCLPLNVQFQDQSWGHAPITQRWWDFGDGTQSSLPNPSHLYASPAYYPVKLKVRDQNGCMDSVTRNNYIFVTQPHPDFTVTPAINCPGVPTTFVSQSSGSGLSYLWEFGDGTTSNLANPRHAYADTGRYTVRLTITDVNGCDSSITRVNAVYITPIWAHFTYDTTYAACPPLQVNFSADAGFPHPDLRYAWSFGNGATSSQVSPSHVYTLPGIYDVSLIVSTASGCADTMRADDLIRIEGPSATFTYDPPYGCLNTPVVFTASSSDSVSYEWIFADGYTGSGQQTVHSYAIPGTFYPSLVVEDGAGCRVFYVNPNPLTIFVPPVAAFTASPPVRCGAGPVQFADGSSSRLGIAGWSWDFGDGQTSTLSSPLNVYHATGSYDVTLIVTDTRGCRDTVTQPDAVRLVPQPQPVLQASADAGCLPFSVHMAGSVLPGHLVGIASWAWSINGQPAAGQGTSLDHTFTQAGLQTVQLTVTDSAGCSAAITDTLTARANPAPRFSAADSLGCAPFSTQFEDLTGGNIIRWEWTFGDGQFSPDQHPAHTYTANGQYEVSLRVWDGYGCTGFAARSPMIRLEAPQAAFSLSDTVICPGASVEFRDQSTGAYPLNSWHWEFGDAQTGEGQVLSHAYPLPGRYSITLTVTDTFGCSHTLSLPQVLRVLSDELPVAPALRSASVLSDQEVEIRLEPYDNRNGDFGAYRLYRQQASGLFVLAGEWADLTRTSFTDLADPGERPIGYRLEVANSCGLESDPARSAVHRTVHTRAVPGAERALVSWTPYEGWNAVDRYQIFRTDGYTPGSLIAEVPGTQTSYTDHSIYCPELVAYRVQAVGGPGRMAWSDTAQALPSNLLPAFPNHVVRATVENNAYVLLDWEQAPVDHAETLVIERNGGGGYREVFRQDAHASNTKFQDQAAEVGRQPYAYRVFTVDSCGDRTPLGRPGVSIHLQAQRSGGEAILSWTPYQGWEQGVDRYTVQLYREATGQFEIIETLPGTAAGWRHSLRDAEPTQNCYRILAWEAGGNQALSYSNEVCVVPEPLLYGASAFTPNGDGYNDTFTLSGAYLAEFTWSIYNRWGVKIFESHDPAQPWDGRTETGEAASEGVYVYLAQGRGFEGQRVELRGSITLIR
ncbi:MAG: PKD domain-containing protein [Bacteroidia bacterium]|nr:PKD domain-containing protein [Bacteroidia bacterium]